MSWNKLSWEQWILEDAGEGQVYIRGFHGKHLNDRNHRPKLEEDKSRKGKGGGDKADWDKWRITDAGFGRVFMRSNRGHYLQDSHGRPYMTENADNWEKWDLRTLDGKPACTYHAVTFFCFAVMRSWGHELEMMKKQYETRTGVFGCDDGVVMSDQEVILSKEGEPRQYTEVISHEVMEHPAGVFDNHELFLDVWEKVRLNGRYKVADWTIKMDPDTLFIADRLRARIGGKSHAFLYPTFYANCRAQDNVQYWERGWFMYGALEIFSNKAVDVYFEGAERCRQHIRFYNHAWEERYLTHCLEFLGVPLNSWLNLDLLSDPYCDKHLGEPDCEGSAVAFHVLDTPEKYQQCYETAHHGEYPDPATPDE